MLSLISAAVLIIAATASTTTTVSAVDPNCPATYVNGGPGLGASSQVVCTDTKSGEVGAAVSVAGAQIVVGQTSGLASGASAGATPNDPMASVAVDGLTVTPFIGNSPAAIRLALAGAQQMNVGWSTQLPYNDQPRVLYGLSNPPQTLAFGSSQTYGDNTVANFHYVMLSALTPGATYFYQITGDDSTAGNSGFASPPSAVLSFTAPPLLGDSRPFTFGLVGDFGVVNAGDTRNALVVESINKGFELVMHVGDISYADDWFLRAASTYEASFDQWQTWMEPITSAVPYMVLPGNHEAACQEVTPASCPLFERAFIPYRNRFRMPSIESGSNSENMWHSYNYGSAHFIHLSSETDIPHAPEGPGTRFNYPDFGGVAGSGVMSQLDWLRADLAAVDRTVTPWVIAAAHRNLYGSQVDNANSTSSSSTAAPGAQSKYENVTSFGDNLAATKMAFEALLLEFKVDMYFGGHQHWYERLWPIVDGVIVAHDYNNMESPLYIVNGAGGNDEDHSVGPQLEWTSVIDKDHYGYNKVDIINATAARVRFISASDGAIIDDITLMRTRDKSMAAAVAPTAPASAAASSASASTPVPQQAAVTQRSDASHTNSGVFVAAMIAVVAALTAL